MTHVQSIVILSPDERITIDGQCYFVNELCLWIFGARYPGSNIPRLTIPHTNLNIKRSDLERLILAHANLPPGSLSLSPIFLNNAWARCIQDVTGLLAPPAFQPIGILNAAKLTNLYPNNNITQIDLTNRSITSIKPNIFINYPNLILLYLYDNQIVNLAANTFNNLINVKIIFLFRNQIVTIDPNAFNNLPNLELIKLNDNQIVNLAANTFNNLPLLNYINLSSNRIQIIQPNTVNNLPNFNHLLLYYQNPPLVYNPVFQNIINNVPQKKNIYF